MWLVLWSTSTGDQPPAPVLSSAITAGAWEPYLVWDHFYATEGSTDDRGRFGLDLDAPERLLATVETDHGAIRNVAVTARSDLRLVTPAPGPSCACWSYDGPMFLAQVPVGATSRLSATTELHVQRLQALPHQLHVERATGDTREITLSVVGGAASVWFPDDGLYGSVLDYHPPIDRFDFAAMSPSVQMGRATGAVVLRGADGVYLLLAVGTGFATQSAGRESEDEWLLLPARWALRSR